MRCEMDVPNEQTQDLRPEILAAIQGLTRLSHRSRYNGTDEPPHIASALLERLRQLCQATRGAIFLTTFLAGDHPGSLSPSSPHSTLYRPLALHEIEEEDGEAFLTPLPTETLWVSQTTLYPALLVWRLPLALPFSPLQNEGTKRQEREQGDDPLHESLAFLLFAWERQDGEPGARALEQGRLLLPLADVVRIVLVRSLVREHIRELEKRADRKALREMELLKTELLVSVSHELRSPLTSIKGYAATLLRHEQRISHEERREFLFAITDASDRLAAVIDSLLEMSELEMGRMKIERALVDLPSLVQEAVFVAEQRVEGTRGVTSFIMAPSAQKRPTFEVLLETPRDGTTDQKLIIQADQNRLREVLNHLLENAIKHTPESGIIRLLVRLVRSAESMEELVAFSRDGGTRLVLAQQRYRRMAVIIVQDSGKGIPEDALERIFAPFYRVDTRLTREVNGLGLGLTICRRIIELHNGIIWAESETGKGSTFFVCLPIDGKD
ncbi:MAG: hypothetical protein NVS4B9_15900 [Ktedonobacteraceae bacterium]